MTQEEFKKQIEHPIKLFTSTNDVEDDINEVEIKL